MTKLRNIKTIGLVGFGAFGRLMAQHLSEHFHILVHDPALDPNTRLPRHVIRADQAAVAQCDLVILAVPVSVMAQVCKEIAPHLMTGATVVDVGSVKISPARAMLTELPTHVSILGAHPLFGPQSAAEGIAGHKVALCPLRGDSTPCVAAFLRKALGLKVHITTPQAHDRDAAVVQGLTHLIAKVLNEMGPMPEQLTTASFEHLMRAAAMVRDDTDDVFKAIEQDNPYAKSVREEFFALANKVCGDLSGPRDASVIQSTTELPRLAG